MGEYGGELKQKELNQGHDKGLKDKRLWGGTVERML